MKQFFMDGLKYWGYPNKLLVLQTFALIGLFFNLAATFVSYFLNEVSYMLSGIIFIVIFGCLFFIIDKRGMKEMKKKVMVV